MSPSSPPDSSSFSNRSLARVGACLALGLALGLLAGCGPHHPHYRGYRAPVYRSHVHGVGCGHHYNSYTRSYVTGVYRHGRYPQRVTPSRPYVRHHAYPQRPGYGQPLRHPHTNTHGHRPGQPNRHHPSGRDDYRGDSDRGDRPTAVRPPQLGARPLRPQDRPSANSGSGRPGSGSPPKRPVSGGLGAAPERRPREISPSERSAAPTARPRGLSSAPQARTPPSRSREDKRSGTRSGSGLSR